MNQEGNTYRSSKYGVDHIGSRKVPRLIVTGDHTLFGLHQGGVHVEAGMFALAGTLQGSLDLQSGTRTAISGKQQGSVHVATGASAVVTGSVEGSTRVDVGGLLVIEAGGRLAGSLSNDGEVILRGVFGGTTSGRGDFTVEAEGHVKRPVVRNGVNYYEW